MRKTKRELRHHYFQSALRLGVYLVLGVLFGSASRAAQSVAGSQDFPPFQEIYSLIRSNLSGLSDAELNRAAVVGLLGQLRSQVLLITHAAGEAQIQATDLVSKTAVFERKQAYLRLNGVRPGSALAVAKSFEQLQATNKLSGLVLDFRFAAGEDYTEAGAVADLFLATEQPLLKWGDTVMRSTVKTNAILLPVIMLVNQGTAGASEALVAALRCAGVGLILGSSTAGHTHAFKLFSLSSGHKIGLAAGRIEVGDDEPLAEQGITPDIRVNVGGELEKMYLEDPFKDWSAVSGRLAGANPAGSRAGAFDPSSRSRRTESSLLRQRREGADEEADVPPAQTEPPAQAVVQDPALARALDVLKGLALAKIRR